MFVRAQEGIGLAEQLYLVLDSVPLLGEIGVSFETVSQCPFSH